MAQKKREAESENQPLSLEIYRTLGDVIGCLVAVAIVFVFFVRLVGVVGSSMYPTLHDRDRLTLLSNFFYEPEVGDIVVLHAPKYGEDPLVKRVIAAEGQTVDINFSTGEVYVDGVLLDEPYINEPTYTSEGLEFPLTVPENCIFVMGDNRNASTDSRSPNVGCVDERYVLGKALHIIFPLGRIGAAG